VLERQHLRASDLDSARRSVFASFRASVRQVAIAASRITTKLNAAISAMMTQNPVPLFDMAVSQSFGRV
jgi:hypothetical protein